ncbi:8-oxoguanine glycosylase ogg1 [Diatrype stigma]|uniref:DNA-(apurinic or apyrimidinic site) lyase n=1 Tax=Diatrype stigma TaxID=117547 RepID=A0AAN9YT24_9PEZI
MVLKLCKHYGPFVGHIGDEAFHDFPSPQALAGKGVETHLRELGFGYRARYIAETARILSEDKPEGWLESLANPENPGWLQPRMAFDATEAPTYKNSHEQLLLLTGVGPKVADCVCLMGLGWGEAVPVDTHMWQIAQRDYNFGKGKAKTKTFSKVMYDSVGDHFRTTWGPQAGWAHSVLFTANLKSFSAQAAAQSEDTDVKIKVEEKEQITSEPSSRERSSKRKTTALETVKIEQHVEVEPARNTRRKTRSQA